MQPRPCLIWPKTGSTVSMRYVRRGNPPAVRPPRVPLLGPTGHGPRAGDSCPAPWWSTPGWARLGTRVSPLAMKWVRAALPLAPVNTARWRPSEAPGGHLEVTSSTLSPSRQRPQAEGAVLVTLVPNLPRLVCSFRRIRSLGDRCLGMRGPLAPIHRKDECGIPVRC